jgi:flagellin
MPVDTDVGPPNRRVGLAQQGDHKEVSTVRINQNIAAFNAFRNLSATNAQMGKSLEKLSSGFRINRAADDAAGLVKSESLRAEIRGTRAAIRNAQDGVSFVQTAEGALNEVHSILQRMRELAVDAANTATTDGSAQQDEVSELLAEITAIGSRTTFAGQAVFADYSTTALTFHVGANAGETLEVSTDLGMAASDVFGKDLSSVDVSADADTAITDIDAAIANVSSTRAELGATQNRLDHVVASLSVAAENLSASESRVRDVDLAEEMVSFTRHQIMVQAGTAMLAQANQIPASVLALIR